MPLRADSVHLPASRSLTCTHSSFIDSWNKHLRKVLESAQPILSKGQHVVLYALQDEPTSQVYRKLQKDLRHLAKETIGSLSEYLLVAPLPAIFASEAYSNSLAISLLPSPAFSRPELEMRRFVFRLYDALDRRIKRTTMKVLYEDQREEFTMVQFPSFTLSDDPLSSKSSIDFRLHRPVSNPLSKRDGGSVIAGLEGPDVMTRGMLLLIAYDLSSPEVATASAVDARGQGYDAVAWNRSGTLREDLTELWKFVIKFARKANVLWRIVVSRIGGMEEPEMRGEIFLLS